MSITDHDHRTLYCRMLGHEIPFKYCRETDQQCPCRKIFDCWFQTFDIKTFMENNYSAEQLEQLLKPPKPRITRLYEMIQQAQQLPEDDAE